MTTRKKTLIVSLFFLVIWFLILAFAYPIASAICYVAGAFYIGTLMYDAGKWVVNKYWNGNVQT